MKNFLPLLFLAGLFLFDPLVTRSQDTFSITAVDESTGQVGSAGATCLDVDREGVSAIIISDVIPGRGAIHTQSFWLAQNQANARARLLQNESPEEVILWLALNDAAGNPGVRQYGIADFGPDGKSRAAAYTGINCFDEKGHRTGPDYAIQGNILISEAVLDSMEARFLQTSGSLADRLMAALQGANIPGADSRCLSEGVSSRSAFVRVANPEDELDQLYLDLQVPSTPFGREPIDSLQTLFDQWKLSRAADLDAQYGQVTISPNPSQGSLTFRINSASPGDRYELQIYRSSGQLVYQASWRGGVFTLDLPSPQPGVYFAKIGSKAERFPTNFRRFVLF